MLLSQETIEDAKSRSTVSVISDTHGFSFHRTGQEHKCVEHDSLVVYADGKGWSWYSRGLSGNSAVDWLVKVEGLSFREAVLQLTGVILGSKSKYEVVQHSAAEKKPKQLILPEPFPGKYSSVYMYLTKTRCILPDVVKFCFDKKILYQDDHRNAVFVGYDEAGNAKYASKRGTCTYPNVPAYKMDCSGSDKSYGFVMEGTLKEHIFVFEAPIDAMSHATLNAYKAHGMGKSDWQDCWKLHTRIALGTVFDAALERYVSSHPEVKSISFCLDSDEAGCKAAEVHREKYKAAGFQVNVYKIPLNMGKDYNEYLCRFKEEHKKTIERNAATAVVNNKSTGRY